MARKNDQLDAEEQEILDSFNRGEWVSTGENLDRYREAAKYTFAKIRRINFRVTEKDFQEIQILAKEYAIPYQTLVSSIVHRYLNGRLVDKL